MSRDVPMERREFVHFNALEKLGKRQCAKVLALLGERSRRERITEAIEQVAATRLSCPRCGTGKPYEFVNLRAGVRVRGAIHVQNANACHSRFGRWLDRFHGIATTI